MRNPIPLIGRSLHTQRIGGELVKVLKSVFHSGDISIHSLLSPAQKRIHRTLHLCTLPKSQYPTNLCKPFSLPPFSSTSQDGEKLVDLVVGFDYFLLNFLLKPTNYHLRFLQAIVPHEES